MDPEIKSWVEKHDPYSIENCGKNPKPIDSTSVLQLAHQRTTRRHRMRRVGGVLTLLLVAISTVAIPTVFRQKHDPIFAANPDESPEAELPVDVDTYLVDLRKEIELYEEIHATIVLQQHANELADTRQKIRSLKVENICSQAAVDYYLGI